MSGGKELHILRVCVSVCFTCNLGLVSPCSSLLWHINQIHAICASCYPFVNKDRPLKSETDANTGDQRVRSRTRMHFSLSFLACLSTTVSPSGDPDRDSQAFDLLSSSCSPSCISAASDVNVKDFSSAFFWMEINCFSLPLFSQQRLVLLSLDLNFDFRLLLSSLLQSMFT